MTPSSRKPRASSSGPRAIVVLGAGGHATAVLEVLHAQPAYQVIGCLSTDRSPASGMDVPVLGDDRLLPQLRHDGVTGVCVAVGDNAARQRLCRAAVEAGLSLVSAVSPAALVAPSAVVEAGAVIMPGAILRAHVRVEEGAIVNTGAILDHHCRIEAQAHVAPGATLAGGVTVGAGAMLGAGCTIVPNVRIGAWAIVGAGSVVLHDVPERVTVVGNPARVVAPSASQRPHAVESAIAAEKAR